MFNETPSLEKLPKSLKSKLRLGGIILAAVVFVVFAIANSATVEINLLLAQVAMPRFLMLVGVFGLGGLAGWLVRGGRKKA